jgi:hypothetical protein
MTTEPNAEPKPVDTPPAAPEHVITVTDQSNGTPAWEKQLAETPARAPDGKFAKAEKPESDGNQIAEGDGNKIAEGEEAKGEAKDRLPDGVKKRVDRVERQRDAAKAEKDEFAAKLNEVRALAERITGLELPGEPGDYKTHAEYVAAKSAYAAAMTEAKGKIAAAKPKPEEAKPADEFSEALGELKATVEGADAGLWKRALEATTVEISQSMIIALADHDDAPGALRFLLDNPEKAEEISKLSTARAMTAILALKGKPAEKPKAETPKKVTSADDPPEPINTRSAGTPVDLGKASMAEFKEIRNKQDGARDRFGW